jgi:hypothetical protein
VTRDEAEAMIDRMETAAYEWAHGRGRHKYAAERALIVDALAEPVAPPAPTPRHVTFESREEFEGAPPEPGEPCPECGGDGMFSHPGCPGCLACDGPCSTCGGSGRVPGKEIT